MSFNPQDQKIFSFLEQNEADDALEFAFETYFPSLKKSWQEIFAFFTDDELEYAFGKAFESLKKEEGEKNTLPYLDYLKKEGLAFLKSNFRQLAADHPEVAIVRAFSENEESMINQFYDQNKAEFSGFAAKKYPGCDDHTVLDVYQDALVVLVENYVQKNRIRILEKNNDTVLLIGLRNNASLTTFLFSIAKRMLPRKCSGREHYIDPDDFLLPRFDQTTKPDDGAKSDRIQKMMTALAKLSASCQEIIKCKYWFGMSMEEIKEQIGARSAGAVRTRKKRCMDRLKEMVVRGRR